MIHLTLKERTNEINQHFRKQKFGNALAGRLAHSHRLVAATQYEALRHGLNSFGGCRHSRRYLDLARSLVGRTAYELANGTVEEYPFGLVEIAFMAEITAGRVIFGPDNAEPFLGVTALESVCVTIDPASRTLKRLPAIPLKYRSSRACRPLLADIWKINTIHETTRSGTK